MSDANDFRGLSMARALHHKRPVRLVHVALLALGVLLLISAAAHAGAAEVDDQAAALTRLEGEHARAAADMQTLVHAYQQKADAVAALKSQPASWGRDRKLGALLAESK